ncbi:MAG: hypothetical protein H5U40_18705 [Polyangiaceae bacterium]|nr:hypothetical protein [Polyangiaceae bacterium]
MLRLFLLLTTTSWLLHGCADREGGAPVISLAECEAISGEALLDPGDGSVFEQGCGEGLLLLGYLDSDEVEEGGLCCEVAAF